ncbi:MAG: hypothetical protein CBARDMAM_0175 [uncultured Caballeronia sp.]|nr:MAG: hypothetical protein CBARDMAM_0175 [uncultured Caballeronia sp.]
MLVVVEGIETTEELILAVESNVNFAQVFLLGKPRVPRCPRRRSRGISIMHSM